MIKRYVENELPPIGLFSNRIIFSFLILLYAFASLILNEIGFVITGIPILALAIVVVVFAVRNSRVVIPASFSYFILFYTLLVLSSFSYWKENFDVKDIIAAYLFFAFIPFLIRNSYYYFPSFREGLNHSLPVIFLLFSLILMGHGIGYGINWNRSMLFENPNLNKNGISAIYEVLYIFILFNQKGKDIKYALTVIFIGIVGFAIIGSKTSLAISLLFSIGLFSKKIFYIGLASTLLLLINILINTVDIEQSYFKTANFRPLLWSQAINESFENVTTSLIGNGPGTFFSEVRTYGLQGKLSPHNYGIQLLHHYGVIGLCVFIFYFAIVYKSIGFWRTPAAAAFWAFNLHSLFDVGWVKGSGFFASLALGIALNYKEIIEDHITKVSKNFHN